MTARLVLSHLGVAGGVALMLSAGLLFVHWRSHTERQSSLAQRMSQQLSEQLGAVWNQPAKATSIVNEVRRRDKVKAGSVIVFGIWEGKAGSTTMPPAFSGSKLSTYQMTLTLDAANIRRVIAGETQDDAIAWSPVTTGRKGLIAVDLGPVAGGLGIAGWAVIAGLGLVGLGLGLLAGWTLSRKLVVPLRALPAVTYAGSTGGEMKEAPATAPLEIQMVWRTSTQAVADSRAAARSDLLRQRRQRELFRQMSHDLRAPTALMSAMVAELKAIDIADPELQAQRDARLSNIEAQLRQLQTQIADVVAAANASVEDPSVVVDVTSLVCERLRDLEPYFTFRGVQVDERYDPGTTILARPVALGLTIGELVMNALRYGNGGGIAVTVTKHPEELTVTICVEDAGAGIPEEDRERVLQAGERGPGTSGAGGFGLGLAMARDVVRHMGGSLVLGASPRLGGLAVTVEFPLVAAERPWLGQAPGTELSPAGSVREN